MIMSARVRHSNTLAYSVHKDQKRLVHNKSNLLLQIFGTKIYSYNDYIKKNLKWLRKILKMP